MALRYIKSGTGVLHQTEVIYEDFAGSPSSHSEGVTNRHFTNNKDDKVPHTINSDCKQHIDD